MNNSFLSPRADRLQQSDQFDNNSANVKHRIPNVNNFHSANQSIDAGQWTNMTHNAQYQLASHRAQNAQPVVDKTKNTLDELLRRRTAANPIKVTDKKLEGIIQQAVKKKQIRDKTLDLSNKAKTTRKYNIEDEETRSVAQELDYTQKDAQRRLLFRQQAKAPSKLRENILINLENIKQGKRTNPSEINSIRSRTSKFNSIISRNSLAQISRKSGYNEANVVQALDFSPCEICRAEFQSQDDINLCKQVTQMLVEDAKLQKFYNEYRFSKGFDVCDFQKYIDNPQDSIQICTKCLNDCFSNTQQFQVQNVDASAEKQSVSAINPQTIAKMSIDYDQIKPVMIQPNSPQNQDRNAFKAVDQMNVSMDNFNRDDLQIQRKKKYFTHMHQTSSDFNDLRLPSSNMQKLSANVDDMPLNSYAGEWVNMQNFPAAGSRMPRPFKKTFVDKIPNWVDQMQKDGKSKDDIKQALALKSEKYIDKYGNKSRVGMVIDMYSAEDSKRIESMKVKPSYSGSVQPKDSNCLVGVFDQRKQQSKQQKIMQNRNLKSPQMVAQMIEEQQISHYQTTNMDFHATKTLQDFSAYKKNFKKKTPLTQWSNAYFSGGVFFNPPVNGI